jgi:hypothetical protein
MFIEAYETVSNFYGCDDFKNPYTIGLVPRGLETEPPMSELILMSVEALMNKFHNTNVIVPLTEEQIYDNVVEYIEDLGVLKDFSIWYSTPTGD